MTNFPTYARLPGFIAFRLLFRKWRALTLSKRMPCSLDPCTPHIKSIHSPSSSGEEQQDLWIHPVTLQLRSLLSRGHKVRLSSAVGSESAKTKVRTPRDERTPCQSDGVLAGQVVIISHSWGSPSAPSEATIAVKKKWRTSPFLCRTKKNAHPTFLISDTTAHKNLAGTVITYSSFSRATRWASSRSITKFSSEPYKFAFSGILVSGGKF